MGSPINRSRVKDLASGAIKAQALRDPKGAAVAPEPSIKKRGWRASCEALREILVGCSTDAIASGREAGFAAAYNDLYGCTWVRFRKSVRKCRPYVLADAELTEAIADPIEMVNTDPCFAHPEEHPITFGFGQRVRVLGNLTGANSMTAK